MLQEFKDQNAIPSPSASTNKPCMQSCNISWSPPAKDFLKLNVDAHLIGDGRWGLGMILRREDGGTVAVATRVVRSEEDAKVAEALGIYEALKLIQHHNLNSVIIESDSQNCIQAIHSQKFDKSPWGKLIRSCVVLCSCLEKIEFMWTRRSGNGAAHEAARWARIEPDRYWTCNFPRPVFYHIQKDMIL